MSENLQEMIDIADLEEPDIALESLEIAVNRVEIHDDADYTRCNQMLRLLKQGIKDHEAHWEKPRAAAWELYQWVMAKITDKTKPAAQLRKTLESKMSDYRLKQQKLLRERQAVAAQENQRALSAAQQESRDLILSGKPAEGMALMQKARLTTQTVEAPKLKLEGTSQIEDFDLEITDLLAFLREVADGVVPLEVTVLRKKTPMVEVRMSALKELRRSMGEAFAVKGVLVKEKVSYRDRRC